MASTDAISSGVVLVLFLAIVYGIILAYRKATTSASSASSRLSAAGVTYENGTIKVKTDRAPMTFEQQVAAQVGAVDAATRKVMGTEGVVSFGDGKSPAVVAQKVEVAASGVETPTRGFRRTKKLD